MADTAAAIVLYDADCGWCRWSLAQLLRWDRRRRLATLPIQVPAADAILAGLTPQQRLASWHLCAPDGRLYSGGTALAPLFALLPGGAPVARVAAALPRSTAHVYRWIAAHRRLLSRPLRPAAIARADKLVDERRSPAGGALGGR
jgi:predicted DCC family thiol-disulfide oxidoreductase YuxK